MMSIQLTPPEARSDPLSTPLNLEQWVVRRWQGSWVLAVWSLLVNDKKTGTLTINFSQGRAASIEWKERG